jgi:hypothetical protein
MCRVLGSEKTQHHECTDKRFSKPANVSPNHFAPNSGNLVINYNARERQIEKGKKIVSHLPALDSQPKTKQEMWVNLSPQPLSPKRGEGSQSEK